MNAAKFIVHRSSFIVLFVLACAKPAAPPARSVERVVSLAPNVTEMLFAAGCGKKVVGTDDFSNWPAEASRLPRVGGVEPNVEKIVALRPDLVIASASAAHPSLRRALAGVRLRLLVVRTERLSEIATAMTTIGHATGCRADDAVSSFNRTLESERRWRKQAPRALFTVWTDPLYIAGRETFIDDLYQLTGWQNAAPVQGWPQYSLESFIANPPDVLLYPKRSVTREAVAALLARVKAPVEAIAIDDDVFTRPGPRLANAAAELNRIADRREQKK
jgi:iron complex transport system substrate-binding protein